MQSVREKFSFSNIIALIALFVAMGGSAYAGAKIGTSQIQNGAVTGSKLSPKLIQWARISSGGDEINGRGLVRSQKTGTGRYVVTFRKSVDSCGISGVPDRGLPNDILVAATKNSGASGAVVNARQVEVTIGDDAGFEVDQDFRLIVIC